MELLIKVGDSGGYKDGQIISVKPSGWLISPTDMEAWIDDGKEPAVLTEMPEYQVNRLKRRVNRLRWELSHTAVEIAAEFNFDEEESERRKAMAESDCSRMMILGVDTNWGYEDLKVHHVLRVAKIDDHDYIELVDRDRNIDHIARIKGKRRYCVNYAPQYSPAELVDIRDKAKRVEVDRVTVVPRAAVQTIAQGRSPNGVA